MMNQKSAPDYFGSMPFRKVIKTRPKRLKGKFRYSKAFIRVLGKKLPTFRDMGKADAYTYVAFKHPEKGMNEFPPTPEARKKGVPSRIGMTGDISSLFHLEGTLPIHSPLTVGLLDEDWHKTYGKEEVPWALVIAAGCHDYGKKWCACTNVRGEISSYGHAQCSAYAVYWKLEGLVDQETREVIAASIYGHDLIKRWTPDDEKKFEKYLEDLGKLLRGWQNRMINMYAEMIADADAGVKKIIVDDHNREVAYVIAHEHFNKDTGRIEEVERTLTVDKFAELLRRGTELYEKAIKVLRKNRRRHK